MSTALITTQNKIHAVEALYNLLPVGEEVGNLSARIFADRVGMTQPQADRIIRQLESVGVLSRRTKMGFGGKVAFWKLEIPMDEAIRRASMLQSPQNKANNASLRSRILAAVEEHGKFDSVIDILSYIKADPAENIDFHSATHILTALREQGKVTFKRDNSGRKRRGGRGNQSNNVPYDIELGKMHVVSNSVPAAVVMPDPEPRPEPTPEPVSIIQPMAYPLIQRIIMRREFLERAALLAEQADEADIALSLLEKAKDSMSPFEQEVANLWNAYQECKD